MGCPANGLKLPLNPRSFLIASMVPTRHVLLTGIGRTDFRRPKRTTRCPPCPLSNVHPCFLSQALNCRGVIDERPSVVSALVSHWCTPLRPVLLALALRSSPSLLAARARPGWASCCLRSSPSLYGRNWMVATHLLQCKHVWCVFTILGATGAFAVARAFSALDPDLAQILSTYVGEQGSARRRADAARRDGTARLRGARLAGGTDRPGLDVAGPSDTQARGSRDSVHGTNG